MFDYLLLHFPVLVDNRRFDGPITDGLNIDLHLAVGNRVSLEKVHKFCYFMNTYPF